METFQYTIQLEVQLDAFTEQDAKEALKDIFGPGSECGVEIVDCSIETNKR